MRGLVRLRNTPSPANAMKNHSYDGVSPGLRPWHCNKLTVVSAPSGRHGWFRFPFGCSPSEEVATGGNGGYGGPGRATGESGRATKQHTTFLTNACALPETAE